MPSLASRPRALAARIIALVACALVACTLMPAPALAASGTASVTAEQQSQLLEHASIGVRTGSISEQKVTEAYPEADIQHFTSTPDIINALTAGKVDYAMATESVCRRYMGTNDSLTYLEPAMFTVDENFALQKGNDELKSQINGVLSTMRESGELDSIYSKWTYDKNYSMDDVPVRTDGPVLKVAICATNEPKVFIQDGRFCGTDIEIILRVAYELGYQVEFQDMAFNAELASVSSGKSDIALSYSRTDEREKELDFSDAYTHDDIVFLTNKSTVSEYLGDNGSSSDQSGDSSASGGVAAAVATATASLGSEDGWKLIANLVVVAALACGLALALRMHGHTRRRRVLIWVATAAIAAALATTSLFIRGPSSTSSSTETESDTLELTEEKRDELLSDSSIGVQLGGLVEITIGDKYPNADKQVFESIPDTIAALGAGKIAYACAPDCIARLYMRQNSNYTFLEPSLYEVDDHFGLAKGSQWKTQIDAAIKELKQAGTIDEVYQKWVVDGDYDMSDVTVPTEGETLVVAYSASDEPMMFLQDGQPAGCDVELMYLIAQKIGVQIEWVNLPLTTQLASLSTGKLDVALGLAYTEERANQIDFTAALYSASWVVMTTKSNTAATEAAAASNVAKDETSMTVEKQYELMADKTVATAEGSLDYTDLTQKLGTNCVAAYPSDAEAAAALAAGHADYASVAETYAVLFQRQNAGYVRISPSYLPFDNCFGIAKGNTELKDKIDAILQRMTDDGTIDKLHKKWVNDGDYDMSDVPKNTTGPVLRVAVTLGAEPLSFIQDGEHVGLDCEVIERVAYELGMQVEYYDMNFTAELAAVTSNKVDVACALTPTDERKQEIDFTLPYFTSGSCILMKTATQTKGATLAESLASSFERTFITENRWKLVVDGLGVTMLIAVGSFALASVAGAGLCAAGRSKHRWLRGLAKLYGRLASGIPLLVWLMVTYYIVFAGVDVSAVLIAILSLGLVGADSIAGVYDTGLAAVDKGEIEAASAMGFSRAQTFRHIVLPQAAGRVWNLYAGEFTGLIKATSIVGYVAITDLTKASDIIRSRTFEPFFPLFATALVYFAVIALAGWLFSAAARRMDPKQRGAKRVLKGIRGGNDIGVEDIEE